MKTIKFSFLAILFVSFLLNDSCKKDKGDEISVFVGDYVITKAAVSVPVAINVEVLGAISIPAGTDITAAIQTALLSSVACSSPDKSYVELREDFSMYLSCEGSNPLNAGTWIEMSNTELILNMNNAAIPSSPTGFALSVTDIVIAGSKLTGTTSVPLPKAMIAAMVAPLTLSPATPDILMVTFSLEFQKK